MIFLSIDQNQIKILFFKKTVFSQYEVNYFRKTHQTPLLNNNKIEINLLASAIKEGLDQVKKNHIDKEICLILPQDFFIFLRTDLPLDITPSAISSFVLEKVKKEYQINDQQIISEFFIKENSQKKIVNFFGFNLKHLESFQKIFDLLNLKLNTIIPETLTYLKLFEKTLRSEKQENIFFVHYQKENAYGYFFDNFGLIDDKKWRGQIDQKNSIEKLIKEKRENLEKKQLKINRLIISGPMSENVRQDTFTKNVGIWTNPLKKIITNFYQDYLKILMVEKKETLPILDFDSCFGAFIFLKENPNFSFFKIKKIAFSKNNLNHRPNYFSNKGKELFVFFISFLLSFIFFIFLSNIKTKINLPSIAVKIKTPTATPTQKPPSPTPTPTIVVEKEKIRIKVLNGSGTPGKAATVKEVLRKKGYQEILTGNADNFDYEKTEVLIKKEKNNLISLIKEDLKEYVASFKVNILDEKDASDIIIIIGKDFK